MGEPEPIEEWPVILQDYEVAIAEFDSVSRALTAALVERNPADFEFLELVESEERAREAVILARTRLMNRLRDSTRLN
jgi:hypothetical protein